MKLPALYKKSSTGALLGWEIEVVEKMEGGLIVTRHGQVGGATIEGCDLVVSGKNFGRANATTPLQQAELEAAAKWEKKRQREGYVADRTRAEAGDTDAEGGIASMLAQPQDKGLKKIKYPCTGQRKLNGNRVLAVVSCAGPLSEVSLWSRKRKQITSMPHIAAAYLEWARDQRDDRTYIFDGEGFRFGWSLQKISGFFRSAKPKPGHEEIAHCVYDLPSSDGPWTARAFDLDVVGTNLFGDVIRRVTDHVVDAEGEVKSLHDKFVGEGYEGLILRNYDGLYAEDKRSYDLVKVKVFSEREFEIVGVGEGRGKFSGKAVFSCRLGGDLKTAAGEDADPDTVFEVCAPGTLDDRAEMFRNRDTLVGKKLTIKFFELSDDGVPLFPVGLVVRDYE